jgi:hypothetical protein
VNCADRLDQALSMIADRAFKADTIVLPAADYADLQASAQPGTLEISGPLARYRGVGLLRGDLFDDAHIDAHSMHRADNVRRFKLVSRDPDSARNV